MDKELETHLDGMEKRLSIEITKSIKESEQKLATTIGDVVTLIDKRFNDADERFEQVDKRFDDIEEKLTPLVNQVSGHEKRGSFLEERVL